MTDTIHSCSYYCQIPACIKAQRDELREYIKQRTWVGLSGEEAVSLMKKIPHLTIGGLLAVEAKLYEKNNA